MYLPFKYWGYDICLSQTITQRGEKLLLGDYKGFTFPIKYIGYLDVKSLQDTYLLFNFHRTNYGGLNFLVTNKVVDMLSSNGITGWKTYPVEVTTRDNVHITGFNGFTITGRCKAVKPSLIEDNIMITPPYKNAPTYPGYKGFPLDLATWDGSDIFILEHTLYKFVTDKVKNIFNSRDFKCVAFEDIAEMTYPQKDAIWKSPMGVIVNK